ncbi:MAG: type II secretion system F family protein [Candidatus Diapherotrites archaeon]
MGRLDFLKRRIGEKKESDDKKSSVSMAPETVDDKQVDRIVTNMKKKYKDQGVEMEEVGGKLKELRGIIAEGKADTSMQSVDDLSDFKAPTVQKLGNFYLKFKILTHPITRLVSKTPQVKEIDFYLYSANMKYSARQYVALSVAAALVVFFFMLILMSVVAAFGLAALTPFGQILVVVAISVLAFFFALVVMLLNPRRRARIRGENISMELPFALRHMATELRAGIGLYRTLQAIAVADYGDLSEEFARTINEIEEGTDTKLALRHMAQRCQSKALANALMHVIRALKTGGNLSDIMNEIAEDVAFELRTKVRDFAEKMNFFGVIFIFVAIVLPVFVAILGGIRNTPLSMGGMNVFEAIPLTVAVNGAPMVEIFYLLLMPMILGWLVIYITMTQPRV